MKRGAYVKALGPLLVALLATVNGRLLLAQEEEAGCNKTAATWDFSSCQPRAYNSALNLVGGGGGGGGGGVVQGLAQAAPGSVGGGGGGFARSANLAMPVGGGPGMMAAAMPAPSMPMAAAASAPSGKTIGFRTGGAQDVENFRENIKQGFLPLPTDVTFEGIVKDYYFDTSGGNREPCTDLFCPIYSAALAPDPLLGEGANQTDVFMAVGLDSGMKEADFKRKRLNLVLLLDISGSMGSPFDEYYYDNLGNRKELPEAERSRKKIDIAKEVLTGVLDKLSPQDSVAIVLFDDSACVPKPLGPVSCVDMAALKKGVEGDVHDRGGTNLQAGYDEATRQLKECREADPDQVENRIILITDAQPNTGDFTTEGLGARMKANAADGIYLTIVGVGLDFNTELIESISKVKGANYFSVHTPGEFKERLVDQFDMSVTPLVFDLVLKVDPSSLEADGGGKGWKILHVYGSPNPNDTALSSDGTIMRINTLFPSPKTEEGIKGGVVLLRMKPPSTANTPLELAVSYTDRAGKAATSRRTVALPGGLGADAEAEYESSGVRKAVLLARYTDLLKDWLLDQWESADKSPRPIVIPLDACDVFPAAYCNLPPSTFGFKRTPQGCELDDWLVPRGCILPPPITIFPPLLSCWEHQSQKLAVNSGAQDAFEEFLPFWEAEVRALGDSSLNQETDILKKLSAM